MKDILMRILGNGCRAVLTHTASIPDFLRASVRPLRGDADVSAGQA